MKNTIENSGVEYDFAMHFQEKCPFDLGDTVASGTMDSYGKTFFSIKTNVVVALGIKNNSSEVTIYLKMIE